VQSVHCEEKLASVSNASGRLRHPNGRCSEPTGKPDRDHLYQMPSGRLRHPNGRCSEPTGKPDRDHL
jgi:hypothetical protein